LVSPNVSERGLPNRHVLEFSLWKRTHHVLAVLHSDW